MSRLSSPARLVLLLVGLLLFGSLVSADSSPSPPARAARGAVPRAKDDRSLLASEGSRREAGELLGGVTQALPGSHRMRRRGLEGMGRGETVRQGGRAATSSEQGNGAARTGRGTRTVLSTTTQVVQGKRGREEVITQISTTEKSSRQSDGQIKTRTCQIVATFTRTLDLDSPDSVNRRKNCSNTFSSSTGKQFGMFFSKSSTLSAQQIQTSTRQEANSTSSSSSLAQPTLLAPPVDSTTPTATESLLTDSIATFATASATDSVPLSSSSGFILSPSPSPTLLAPTQDPLPTSPTSTLDSVTTRSAPTFDPALASTLVSASASLASESSVASILSVSSASVASAATAQANFVLPGQQLSVLPIGLGVFAGVSILALVIVGFVTYERKKYRGQFRRRKMEGQVAAGVAASGRGRDDMVEVRL